MSTEPFLVAHIPTPAWVEENPFASQHCSPVFLPSRPCSKPAKKAHAVFLATLRFPCWASRNTQQMVPAVPSLYSCYVAQPQEGKGIGLSTMDTLPDVLSDGRGPQCAVAFHHCRDFIL